MDIFSLEAYKFDIPRALVAQRGRILRDACRLMVVSRDLPAENPIFEETYFYKITKYLKRGDVLVLNAVRVAPVRLFGRRKTGGRVELFVLKRMDSDKFLALARPSSRLKSGEFIFLDSGEKVLLEKRLEEGKWVVSIGFDFRLRGKVPLPPYIKAPVSPEFYNPVYSEVDGAVAAPTAGLHFTDRLLEVLEQMGVIVKKLYLKVSLGTFKPVKTSDIRHHKMDEEEFYVPEDTAREINMAIEEGRRVFAVGTTVVRTLESFPKGKVKAGEGKTSLYILPGFRFKNVSALITNFHTPGSTLLALVSAFARKPEEPAEYGYLRIKRAYEIAVAREYAFFSLGDAMLII